VTIAPAGEEVAGTVASSDPGGRVSGVANITVALASLKTADGQTIRLDASSFRADAQTTKGKDAAKVGIGAGIGAAIGGIAGGGKGAAIGAAAGGGAGTAAALATRGAAAEIPAESMLDFELKSPITITEASPGSLKK
jgi:hypothetical protein